ncbi:hypothetical protein DFJ58DRAFT_810541 [Suillus subalutaceus]|uniref:uncharacterized protein n=1 Tax=Suillus subalutaceus TaxID=48586 RepID=UPI001B86F294|nr:uncharacterized protein DFJ58DRAFT_810541 [Suillus subalutaceus]KAG1840354.1 hypothetical protein DFJ58DRAFT_810541 [Suillus subalutaceus]
MWIEQKTSPWRRPVPNHPEFEVRILAFVRQILTFTAFGAKLAKVTTVDQLLRDHVDFLDTYLKECILTMTCSTFAPYTSFTNGDGHQAMNKRWEFLKKFELSFNHCTTHRVNVSLLPLMVRLSGIKAIS